MKKAVYRYGVLILFCFVVMSAVYAGFCSVCGRTIRLTTAGEPCETTYLYVDSQGVTHIIPVSGTWSETVEYDVCKVGFGIFCTNHPKTFKPRCRFNPCPNTLIMLQVTFNVEACER